MMPEGPGNVGDVAVDEAAEEIGVAGAFLYLNIN